MMAAKLIVFVLLAVVTLSNAVGETETNYDNSRIRPNGFGFSQILDYLLGAGYGNGYYQGSYPGVQGPGSYPGNYPGGYHPGLVGPPGAHPGCPLCDSSVYSYCSHKEAHDACCCENSGYAGYGCQNANCNFLYANSCQEYRLITDCCCVDLHKSAGANVVAL